MTWKELIKVSITASPRRNGAFICTQYCIHKKDTPAAAWRALDIPNLGTPSI